MSPPSQSPPIPPGDPSSVRKLAAEFTRFGGGMLDSAALFERIATAWTGSAATAFATILAVSPREFASTGHAFGSAARVLSAHAETLERARELSFAASLAADDAGATRMLAEAVVRAGESARAAAQQLHGLTENAPRHPGLFTRVAEAAATWQAEIHLGVNESLWGTVDLAARFSPLRIFRDPGRSVQDGVDLGRALVDSMRHPAELVTVVTDIRTWQENPARALGHLAPDVVAALVTGGAAGASRSTRIANGLDRAASASASTDSARRIAVGAAAKSAHERLIGMSMSLSHVLSRSAAGPGIDWIATNGTRLAADRALAARTLLALTSSQEDTVTHLVARVAKEVDGRLAGLENRMKDSESLLRKLATSQAEHPAWSAVTLLATATDNLRFTIVLARERYADGVRQAMAALERLGLHSVRPRNAWRSTRYRGLNSTWIHTESGVPFEVQFHTPASWAITKATHGLYESMRELRRDSELRQRLERRIGLAYRLARRPPDLHWVGDGKLPPPSQPFPLPPDRRVAVGGAAAATAAVSGVAAPPDPRDRPGAVSQPGENRVGIAVAGAPK